MCAAAAAGRTPMDAVSVIIPTYNCAERLVRALDSVDAQTYAHDRIEVVVVDDGSTDDTRERVGAFAARSDLSFRYLRQQNAGPAAARNHGMRVARGKVIAFLDDDDAWKPAKLARQLPLLAGKTGLVACEHEKVNGSGLPIPRVQPRPLARGNAQLAFFMDFFLLTSAVCILRACIDRVGYFDEQMYVGEDNEFFLRLATQYDFDYAPDVLLVRTIRDDSVSHQDETCNARTCIATLERYLAAHPDFAAANRSAVRQRLADRRQLLAYCLTRTGHRREALQQLGKSLLSRPSLKAMKSCVRAALPL